MGEWVAKYWWMLWALFCVVAIVVYRVRKRGGKESLLRRIVFALLPDTDPVSSRRREVAPAVAITLIFLGLVAIALMLVVVKLFGS